MTTHSSNIPRLVTWESTRACPLSCIHCRAEAQKDPHPDQLKTEEVKALIDDVASMPGTGPASGAPVIFIITGGDPLMRGDIFELAAYADSRGLWTVMSPSGTSVDGATIARMKEAGIRRISLSLDGSTSEIHDSFRKVEGSFERVMEAVRHATEGGMPFQINTTVSQWNIADLASIYELVRKLEAVTWDVFLLVPTGRGKVDLEISADQYEEVLGYLSGLEKRSSPAIKVTCAPHYVRISACAEHDDGQSRRKSSGCMAGCGFAFVSHVGDVFGCGYLPVPAGNIREMPFSRIYRESLLFKTLRDRNLLKGKCGICPWRHRCGGCRARAYGMGGDLLESEPFCLYQPGEGAACEAGGV